MEKSSCEYLVVRSEDARCAAPLRHDQLPERALSFARTEATIVTKCRRKVHQQSLVAQTGG